jgi:hypothetical protein
MLDSGPEIGRLDLAQARSSRIVRRFDNTPTEANTHALGLMRVNDARRRSGYLAAGVPEEHGDADMDDPGVRAILGELLFLGKAAVR